MSSTGRKKGGKNKVKNSTKIIKNYRNKIYERVEYKSGERRTKDV